MQAAIPFGRLSKRNILLFVASVIATTFAYLFFAATPVYAADAKWEQGSVIYEDTTFRGPTQPNERAGHDLPEGTSLYTNLDGTTLKVVYFPAGSRPSSATSANYVTYRVNNSGQLSNKSDPKSITIDTGTSSQADLPTNSTSSSCKVDGIGWIVCPVTNFLATGMDWVFNILSGFVEVQPLETNTNSTMHRIWEIMRNFANIAFVIAFLIIIYSQLTSVGLTNYGIKKLLPRIIIAAILVNVSYWICTLAIDISNILGYSLQGIFLGLRDMVMAEGGGTGWQPISWESIASFILAGGAVGGAAIASVVLASTTMGAFTVGGVILLLLPILLGAFLTVLVVLFILAARQAIIVLLVIISPLALVAYLLPNTEKWFEKWRGLFMTMLIFFPAFSLVFGGAQFAGLMIINAAVEKGDINMMLLGMAVQIAPLAITPLLLKLSGTLLSRIGGLINDPSRGLKDRTKNWSKDRLAARKAGEDVKTREMMQNGTLGKRHVVRRTALGMDTRRRLREGQKSVNETRATSMFNDTSAGSVLNQAEREAEREKTTVQNKLETNWSVKAKIDPESLQKELKLRVTADKASVAKEQLETMYAEAKAGKQPVTGPMTMEMNSLVNDARVTSERLALDGMRKAQAEQQHRSHVDDTLYKNTKRIDGQSVLDYTAGVGSSEMLQATTIARVRKEFMDHVGAQDQLMQHLKLDSGEFQKAASGLHGDIVIDDERGKHTFKIDNQYVREAAIAHQASAGSFGEKLELLEQSGAVKDAAGNVISKGTTYDFRDSIQDMVKKGMLSAAPFTNDKSLNAILRGEYNGRESTIYHSIREIYEGRVKSEAVSTANDKAMGIMYDVKKNATAIQNFYNSLDPASRPSFSKFKATFDTNYDEMRMQASDVLENPILRKNVNKELLNVLENNAMPRP